MAIHICWINLVEIRDITCVKGVCVCFIYFFVLYLLNIIHVVNRYPRFRCPGRLIVKKNDDGHESKPHSHAPDARNLEKETAIDKLKKEAKANVVVARDLVLQACGSVDSPTISVLPKTKNLIATVKRVQSKEKFKLNPKTLDELNFDGNNATTPNGDYFVLHDNKLEQNDVARFVMFGTKQNLQILKSCETLSMDGTFKITPPLFSQLYTIHGEIKNAFPLLISPIFLILPIFRIFSYFSPKVIIKTTTSH